MRQYGGAGEEYGERSAVLLKIGQSVWQFAVLPQTLPEGTRLSQRDQKVPKALYGRNMIARIWQGRTRPGMGESYMSYLEQTGLKEYRATEGFKDVLVLTREIGDETEYVLVTLWESMDAVRRFAGPEPERAVYYPEDDRYFPEEQRTPHVRHYEVHDVRA